jgi:hypothetical protein
MNCEAVLCHFLIWFAHGSLTSWPFLTSKVSNVYIFCYRLKALTCAPEVRSLQQISTMPLRLVVLAGLTCEFRPTITCALQHYGILKGSYHEYNVHARRAWCFGDAWSWTLRPERMIVAVVEDGPGPSCLVCSSLLAVHAYI